MESSNDDDDLKLVRASAGLLSDLEQALPKVLWKPSKVTDPRGRVHMQVKQRDIEYIVNLIEPFQGEPQLLDTKLKNILPALSDAYIEYLRVPVQDRQTAHASLETAVCAILYTLCKVRGYKIVLGFLNNEARYLEPMLARVEETIANKHERSTEWRVPYVLLLWLAHLTITPFDLSSISDSRGTNNGLVESLAIRGRLPAIAERILLVGLKYLTTPTKAQDAAALLIVRLVARPDMQKHQLADALVLSLQQSLQTEALNVSSTIYERLGPLRLLAGVVSSPELKHLIPDIYDTCTKLLEDEQSPLASNAIAKKLFVKILRSVVVLALRSAVAEDPLVEFLERRSVLEEVIDYLLRSLGDRDTPVRYAAAKALSLIILQLETNMAHEVVQAILDSFEEDMPHHGASLDFRQADALRRHGLALALAHVLFRRSASSDQLPDIVNALAAALQFEQRTTTGSSIGTNVRDAANFGIWSLSRRYTTGELLSVDIAALKVTGSIEKAASVLQWLAVQLLLSACLDPAGNIRRGSSAALQELIGRHPDQIHSGIALVQIVDYQAVGLRRRAMEDVVSRAARLEASYWTALIPALFEWRGLGSTDVPSREAAAISLAALSRSKANHNEVVLLETMRRLIDCSRTDVEIMHGLVLLLALLVKDIPKKISVSGAVNGQQKFLQAINFSNVLEILLKITGEISLRLLRSELPSAIAQFLAALCQVPSSTRSGEILDDTSLPAVDTLADRLLARHEETMLQVIPSLVKSLLALKRLMKAPLGILGAQQLCKRVAFDGSKSTLNGAGRAIALGALTPLYSDGLIGEKALTALVTLSDLTGVMNVDWRIIAIRSIQLSVESEVGEEPCESNHADNIVRAVHCGANDYTIDERGDVGSLVRLEAIACAGAIFAHPAFAQYTDRLRVLQGDILRLSLEKLDRVRLAAAKCQVEHMGFKMTAADVAAISSQEYFNENLNQLQASKIDIGTDQPYYRQIALLEGCISCAGISAEPLLQASRAALVLQLRAKDTKQLQHLITLFLGVLKSMLVDNKNMHPALELLAFLLDIQIPQRIAESDFKWRDLLSTVQKAHYKANDIAKILAAVRVYRGLADIVSIRYEVLKKLISMLKTNPYPKVRSNVAEHLYMVTDAAELRNRDWAKAPSQHRDVISQLEERYLKS